MTRIAVIGDIGAGKSYVSKIIGYPVFSADYEVAKIYKADKKCFSKIKRVFLKQTLSFPIKKEEITKAILQNNSNIKKLVKIIHPVIRKKMIIFFKKK